MRHRSVAISADGATLQGDLVLPEPACGVVLFAHGSGSSRKSSRNKFVAERLNQAGLATLLMDLLTEEEEAAERATGNLRFDIGLLSDRLCAAVDWLMLDPETGGLPQGLFGASTGAAAAIVTATRKEEAVQAVVSRGGRPDLAGDAIKQLDAPTMLIVGSIDYALVPITEKAFRALPARARALEIVRGATHLFEEPGALEEVASLATAWFKRFLCPAVAR